MALQPPGSEGAIEDKEQTAGCTTFYIFKKSCVYGAPEHVCECKRTCHNTRGSWRTTSRVGLPSTLFEAESLAVNTRIRGKDECVYTHARTRMRAHMYVYVHTQLVTHRATGIMTQTGPDISARPSGKLVFVEVTSFLRISPQNPYTKAPVPVVTTSGVGELRRSRGWGAI